MLRVAGPRDESIEVLLREDTPPTDYDMWKIQLKSDQIPVMAVL